MTDDRIAVIADIHGNADALRAVLGHIAQQDIAGIANLGDHFSGPLAAGETADILLSRPDILCIAGNHDRYLLTQDPKDMGLSDASAYEQLSSSHLDWLAALPAERTLNDIHLCHGAPGDDLTYLLEALTPQGDVIARPEAEIARLIQDIDAGLILCAHSHLSRAVRLRDGRQVVNPGSVGCPAYTDYEAAIPHVVQSGAPEARYAVLDRGAGGWQVTFHSVPYDTSRMVELAQTAGRSDWASALKTGWLP
jgi:predicted phosphodiesterase